MLLDILGPTAIPTLICLSVGLLLLLIELFTPGVGVSGILGIVALAASIIMQFLWGSVSAAMYILAGVLVIIIVSLFLFIRSLQRGRLSRSFVVLDDKIDSSSTSLSGDTARKLIGKTGTCLTALRPSGIALIEGKRLDVITGGAFIDVNSSVVVTDVQGLHVMVEAVKNEVL